MSTACPPALEKSKYQAKILCWLYIALPVYEQGPLLADRFKMHRTLLIACFVAATALRVGMWLPGSVVQVRPGRVGGRASTGQGPGERGLGCALTSCAINQGA
jgi:hypothetical protein